MPQGRPSRDSDKKRSIIHNYLGEKSENTSKTLNPSWCVLSLVHDISKSSNLITLCLILSIRKTQQPFSQTAKHHETIGTDSSMDCGRFLLIIFPSSIMSIGFRGSFSMLKTGFHNTFIIRIHAILLCSKITSSGNAFLKVQLSVA